MRSARSILIAASLAGAAALALGGGTASAATPLSGNDYIGAKLTHDETVIANQLHFGALINAAFGDDRWAITTGPGSIYASKDGWVHATGDQLVGEAAAHPDGTFSFILVAPGADKHSFYATQNWK